MTTATIAHEVPGGCSGCHDKRNWTKQIGAGSSRYYDLKYSGADELLSAHLKDGASKAMITPTTYRYDAAGNRTSEQADGSVTTSAFNNLNQLTGLSGGGALTLAGTVSEPATVSVGGQSAPVNINKQFTATVQAVAGLNTIPVTATDGSGNVTSRTAQFTVGAVSSSMGYDLAGNMTTNGIRTYEFDAASRLLVINYSGSCSLASRLSERAPSLPPPDSAQPGRPPRRRRVLRAVRMTATPEYSSRR